jgi:cytochrome P450
VTSSAMTGKPAEPAVRAAVTELREYLALEIERRRNEPADDLISALVAAHDDAEALSSNEPLAFVVLLLVASNETTTNLIGNGLLALARQST